MEAKQTQKAMNWIFGSEIISKINEFSVLESKRPQKTTNSILWHPNHLKKQWILCFWSYKSSKNNKLNILEYERLQKTMIFFWKLNKFKSEWIQCFGSWNKAKTIHLNFRSWISFKSNDFNFLESKKAEKTMNLILWKLTKLQKY